MVKHKLDGRFTIRLDPRTDKALFEFARRRGIKRANLIREVLDNFEVAYSLLRKYEELQLDKLNGDVTELVLNQAPEAPPLLYEQLSEVLARAAERRRAELAARK